MREPIKIEAVPEEYRIVIRGDTITVYDGANGRTHELSDLVPDFD